MFVYCSNDAIDTDSQRAIRDHLAMIATKFSSGDFTIPMFIHDRVPPGSDTMRRLSSKIRSAVNDTAKAEQIRITSDDADAIQAVHDFLRF